MLQHKKKNNVRQFIDPNEYSRLFGTKTHSKKPLEVREGIEQLFGNLPRIELFAREKAEGWDVWGNEVESDIDLVA
jgi:site-specific DNA-methyltransferase (adenine-specific)